MELADQPRSDVFHGDFSFWGAAALLALSLILGGGGAESPFLNGLLEAGGALLLCATFANALTGRPLPPAATVPVVLLLATLLLIAAQLVPLPPTLWAMFPGREAAVNAYALTSEPNTWRPLSLDPEATRRFASSLLLPAGLFFAALRTNRSGLNLHGEDRRRWSTDLSGAGHSPARVGLPGRAISVWVPRRRRADRHFRKPEPPGATDACRARPVRPADPDS